MAIETTVGDTTLTEGGETGGAAPGAGTTTPPAPDAAPALTGGETALSTPPTPEAEKGTTTPQPFEDMIPAEYKDEACLQNMKDVPNLIKSFVHAQKLIGADKIPVPTQYTSDEEWTKIFQKLGNPAEVKDYNFEVAKDSTVDEKFMTNYRAAAHKAGILPKQAGQLFSWYLQESATLQQDAVANQSAEVEKGMATLKQEWGEKYDLNLSKAKLVVKEFGDSKTQEWLVNSGVGNSPEMIKFMARIAEPLAEDKVIGSAGSEELTAGMADIEKELGNIQADMKHPYNDFDHPNHKAEVNRIYGLRQKLNQLKLRTA